MTIPEIVSCRLSTTWQQAPRPMTLPRRARWPASPTACTMRSEARPCMRGLYSMMCSGNAQVLQVMLRCHAVPFMSHTESVEAVVSRCKG